MPISFPALLKAARQRQGLTQQEIADALGVSPSAYCGYETGKRQPDLSRLAQLSALLSTSADALLGLKGVKHGSLTTTTTGEAL